MNTDINILTTRDLQIGYEKPLCKSLNLNLKCGNLTCLIGPNGAGKSTLLRTLANLQPPISGQIFISDVSIQSISKSELTRSLSIVLTDKMAAGGLTVYELAAMGRHPYTNFFGRITDDDKNIIDKSLEKVGVMYKKESYVSELSDGERQKVMIAKALAQQTPILILDEPTAFLDAAARIEIMQLLHKLANEQNKAILVSTHEVDLAMQIADNLWLMNKSKFYSGSSDEIIENGFIDELFQNDNVKFDSVQRRFVIA